MATTRTAPAVRGEDAAPIETPIEVDLGRLTAGKPLDLWMDRAGATVARSSWDPFSRTDVVYRPDDPQERLVFLDGEFSHAVRKNALTLGGRWAGLPEGVPVEAAADEVAAARRVVAAAGLGGALYARVDLTRDAAGKPLLLELEATEPTLFVADAPAALERLVGAVGRLAKRA